MTDRDATIHRMILPVPRKIVADPAQAQEYKYKAASPYAVLQTLVDGYGSRPERLDPDTLAKRAVYAAAVDEYRDRPDDFTDADLARVMATAGRA